MSRSSALVCLTVLLVLGLTNTAVLATPRLLVAVVDDTSGSCGPGSTRFQHLLSYSVSDGLISDPDTILSNPGSALHFSTQSSRVHQNRYVVTDLGDIVDLRSGEFLHRWGPGSDHAKLVSAEGDEVILHAPQSSDYFAFSLNDRTLRPFEPSGSDLLPGEVSPDGTMSAHMAGPIGDPSELWLYRLDGEATLLGTGFRLGLSLLSSAGGLPAPRMWLDDRRILTQRSNGVIVTVGIDGSVEPVVDLELPHGRTDDPASFVDAGALGASFLRDAEGNIVYQIRLAGPPDRPGTRAFVLDVPNRTAREPGVVWLPVGSGFDIALAAAADGLRAIRHDGALIGWERSQRAHCRVADGRIALVPSDRRTVRVWTEDAARWQEIRYESPIWVTRSAVVGWYEPEATH